MSCAPVQEVQALSRRIYLMTGPPASRDVLGRTAALVLIVLLGTCAASAGNRLDAPFAKLKKGEKLCMDSIAPGDPFYAQCRACEKSVKHCSGDLRDRIRRSPYL
jgi:hypothetical protein